MLILQGEILIYIIITVLLFLNKNLFRTKLFEHVRLSTKCTAVYLSIIILDEMNNFVFPSDCTLISTLQHANIARCWHRGNGTYCSEPRTNWLCTNNYLTISLYTFWTFVRTTSLSAIRRALCEFRKFLCLWTSVGKHKILRLLRIGCHGYCK